MIGTINDGNAGLQDRSPKRKQVCNRIPDELRRKVVKLDLLPNAVTDNLDIKIEGALSNLLSVALVSRNKNGLCIDTQGPDVTNELVLVTGDRFGHCFRDLHQARIYR